MFALSNYSIAQTAEVTKNPTFIEARYQNGFIYKHATAINQLVNGNISAIDLNYGWQTLGNSQWQQLYRYPKAGFGLYFSMLNYPEVLGNGIAPYGFINIPVLNRGRLIISYNTSLGISYLTKVYDKSQAVKNEAYSTHLNIYFDFSADIAFNLTKQISVITALGITHYSNGAVKMPNLGLNTITKQIGIRYMHQQFDKNKVTKTLKKTKKRNEIWLFYAPSLKAVPPMGRATYFVSSLSVSYTYKVNYKRKLGFGFDLFYDESLEPYYKSKLSNYSEAYQFRPAFHLSQDLVFGNVTFLLESGWYFYSHFIDDKTFYHRLGLKYYFNKNWFVLYALKTHWVTADYMELALGRNFKW